MHEEGEGQQRLNLVQGSLLPTATCRSEWFQMQDYFGHEKRYLIMSLDLQLSCASISC